MPIDWSKVGESAVLMLPTAVVSGYAGARIKARLDRARPVASVSSCRLASGRDLLTTRAEIGLDLTRKLRDCPWADTLVGRVNAAKVAEMIDAMRRAQTEAQQILGYLDEKLHELPSLENASAERKRSFLDEITRKEVRIIDAVMTASLCRQEIALQLPAEEEFRKLPVIAEFVERTEKDGGYSINLRSKWYNLRYSDKRSNPFLLPAAKAFSVFFLPFIKNVLEHVKEKVTRWAADGNATISEVEEVLRKHTHLIVELTVINRGRSPVVFTPWAMLRLFGTPTDTLPEIALVRTNPLWKPEDPLIALQQQEALKELDEPIHEEATGFVVEGGSTLRLGYRSDLALAELEIQIPNLRDILSMQLFLCQVCLKRADLVSVTKSWIFSSTARFGSRGEQFPNQDKAHLKRKWAN